MEDLSHRMDSVSFGYVNPGVVVEATPPVQPPCRTHPSFFSTPSPVRLSTDVRSSPPLSSLRNALKDSPAANRKSEGIAEGDIGGHSSRRKETGISGYYVI